MDAEYGRWKKNRKHDAANRDELLEEIYQKIEGGKDNRFKNKSDYGYRKNDPWRHHK